jgi:hypothetical protein
MEIAVRVLWIERAVHPKILHVRGSEKAFILGSYHAYCLIYEPFNAPSVPASAIRTADPMLRIVQSYHVGQNAHVQRCNVVIVHLKPAHSHGRLEIALVLPPLLLPSTDGVGTTPDAAAVVQVGDSAVRVRERFQHKQSCKTLYPNNRALEDLRNWLASSAQWRSCHVQ